MNRTAIEWTDVTWNPTTGCDKVSAGCKFCYAETLSERLQWMGAKKYANGFYLTEHHQEVNRPYSWQKPRMVFVNSMSDLFHNDVSVEFIKLVFKTMNENPRHTFQVLTKRADRLAELDAQGELTWTPNIWMGVSVEDERVMHRIAELKLTGALTKFLSCEPLIGPLDNLDLSGIDWVIVGGESGKTPRPIEEQWVWSLLSQCRDNQVAFFFKQWGGTNKKAAGALLGFEEYKEWPKQGLKTHTVA